ncbi:hypothetical protein EV421DRAFT_168362 [Armillaria borealis]|uniref:Protein kinase domain-containing protein n=1 Tax=Armillaria borealis TaxID=47425 RepID=A0AA39IXM8_9AGAR|nr:hypothetical protein EV421DRAFT_168362 [Armillaria borealis]
MEKVQGIEKADDRNEKREIKPKLPTPSMLFLNGPLNRSWLNLSSYNDYFLRNLTPNTYVLFLHIFLFPVEPARYVVCRRSLPVFPLFMDIVDWSLSSTWLSGSFYDQVLQTQCRATAEEWSWCNVKHRHPNCGRWTRAYVLALDCALENLPCALDDSTIKIFDFGVSKPLSHAAQPVRDLKGCLGWHHRVSLLGKSDLSME